MAKGSFVKEHPEILMFWDYEKNDVDPKEVSKSSRKKVSLYCPANINHRYEITPDYYSQGGRCFLCKTIKGKPAYSFARMADPEVVAEFVPVEGFADIEDVDPKSPELAHWKCPNGHVWQTSFFFRYLGKKCWCVQRRWKDRIPPSPNKTVE